MSFPDKKYASASAFCTAYFDQYQKAASSVSRKQISDAVSVLNQSYESQTTVYVCGNGGSASIANHLQCDHLKGCQTNTTLSPRVVSLSSNIEIITAIANDISYHDTFVYQLRTMAKKGDVLITISSSGDSENIVKACKWADQNCLTLICMTGFDGGRSKRLADISLHVKSENYGIIEDVHQSLMHILAQYIRLNQLETTTIKKQKF